MSPWFVTETGTPDAVAAGIAAATAMTGIDQAMPLAMVRRDVNGTPVAQNRGCGLSACANGFGQAR